MLDRHHANDFRPSDTRRHDTTANPRFHLRDQRRRPEETSMTPSILNRAWPRPIQILSRVPRRLCVALLVGCIFAYLVVMLRVQFFRFPTLRGLLLTNRSQTTPHSLDVQRIHRSNGTAAMLPFAETNTTAQENVVNPHPFSYLINPRNACLTSYGHVKMLVYVHSATTNFQKRMSLRQTWANRSVLETYNATVVFILGRVLNASVMDQLKTESETYGDIVQEDFLDTYRNLTHKNIAGLKWAAGFCSQVTYILKTDDDVFVNIHGLMRHLQGVVEPQYGTRRLISCFVSRNLKIRRDKKSKWYVTQKEMKGKHYVPYCVGPAYLLSGDMAQLLYKASLVTPFFWIGDVHVTGTLICFLNIRHRDFNRAYSLNPRSSVDKFRKDRRRRLLFFLLNHPRIMYYMWREITSESGLTMKHAFNVTRSNSVPAVARVT